MPPAVKAKPFIAREDQLDTLIREIGRSVSLTQAPWLFHARGGQGCGKRRLYSVLWSRIQTASRPSLWLRPRSPTTEPQPEAWLAGALESIECNRDSVLPGIHAAAYRFNHPATANALATAAADTTPLPPAQEYPLPAQPTEPAPDDPGRLSEFLQVFDEEIVKLLAGSADQPEAALPRVFVVIDRADTLPDTLRHWLGHTFIPAFREHFFELDLRFLTSGRRKLAEVSGLAPNEPTRALEIELPPFTEAQTSAYLTELDIPRELHAELHRKCAGVPQAVESAALHLLRGARQQPAHGIARDILGPRTAREARWILRAAHLGWFNQEALAALNSRAEAEEAQQFLVNLRELRLVISGGLLRFDPGIAEALLQWQGENDPKSCAEDASHASEFRQVVESIPDSSHRDILSLLGHFNHFNSGVLRQVIPADAETLAAFVEAHPGYFVRTPLNIKLAEKYARLIAQWHKHLPHPQENSLRARITAAWQADRDRLLDQMGALEKTIANSEKDLAKLKVEIRRTQKELGIQPQVKVESPRPSMNISPVPHFVSSRGHVVLAIFIQGLGIFLLYTGLLIADQLSLTYSTLGVVLILLGLFWPFKKRSKLQPVQVPPVAPEPPRQPAPAPEPPSQQRRLLSMKLANLDNKRLSLSSALSQQRKDLARHDSLLNEPYC